MSGDCRFLNMRQAGEYIGQSYRWMQKNYIGLLKSGVIVYRVPKDSPKGHLMFSKVSLDKYMDTCRISRGVQVI